METTSLPTEQEPIELPTEVTLKDVTFKGIFLLRLIQAVDKVHTITTLTTEQQQASQANLKELLSYITFRRITDIQLEEGGKVKVEVAEQVAEGGRGITREDIDRLFRDPVVGYLLMGIEEELSAPSSKKKPKKEVVKKPRKEAPEAIKVSRSYVAQILDSTSESYQLGLFDQKRVEEYNRKTGLIARNPINEAGVNLNESESRVVEAILKALTAQNYKGDEQVPRGEVLEKEYPFSTETALALYEEQGSPYKNIDKLPVVRLTQAEILELAGYDLKRQRIGDKQDVTQALEVLGSRQFFFMYIRAKEEGGKKVLRGEGIRKQYEKEVVEFTGSLFNIKKVKNEEEVLQYYEIYPSVIFLDQVHSYHILVPSNWRKEVEAVIGKRGGSYTYKLILFCLSEVERIDRANRNKKEGQEKYPYLISLSWEYLAIKLKMPPSLYKANKKRALKILQEALEAGKKVGYLKEVVDTGATLEIYLNPDKTAQLVATS